MNKKMAIYVVLMTCLVLGNMNPAHALGKTIPRAATPPYSGTIFLDPDIITPSDPTTFTGVSYTGRGIRTMFDRRVNNWVTVNAYLFNAKFNDGLKAEVQVNPEFGSSGAAQVEAEKYAWYIGQLPTVSRLSVKTVSIHKGTQPFGGGNNNILIHTGQSALYEADGILEETLIHESSHTSLDAKHATSSGWKSAQTADGNFISTYAQDYPTREDVAESFLPYFALRYRSDRVDSTYINTVMATMPNRMNYFDQQGLDMYPVSPSVTVMSQTLYDGWILESKSSSSKGGKINSSGTVLNLGDDAGNRQYRSILSFDLNLPNNAVITYAALKFKKQGSKGTGNPVTLFGGFMTDIKSGSFDLVDLASGDFSLSADKTLGPFKSTPTNGWYALNISSAKASINPVGTTQVRLRFKLQDNKNALANILGIYSGGASGANQPKLVVQYYLTP